MIDAYRKLEDEAMEAASNLEAETKVKENVEFFFSRSRNVAEWNKTALIKLHDHKKRTQNGTGTWLNHDLQTIFL